MNMLRIEAGLPLVDVEWRDSRTAWSDHDRVTPRELGMGWMLKGVRDRSRRFIGSEAIRRELIDGTSRWATTGIVVDWADWDRLHRDAGELPTKDERPVAWSSGCMTTPARRSATSRALLLTCPAAAHRHGQVPPALSEPGNSLRLETMLHHGTSTVAVRTAPLPFFNPPRKTAKP